MIMAKQTRNCSKCNGPLDKAGNCPRCDQFQKEFVYRQRVMESNERKKEDEEIEF